MSVAYAPASPVASRVHEYLVSLLPCVTARTLAVCRVLLGGSVLYFLWQYHPDTLSILATSGPRVGVNRALDGPPFLIELSGNPAFRNGFYWTLIALCGLFTLGALSRVVMPLLTAGLWVAALLLNWGHFATPLLLGMTAAVPAPWGAAWSIDSLFSRPKPVEASPYYGYAMWLIGLSIGLAYASAGLSKIILTDGAWLWNTGARNGLIQDLQISLSDVGILVSNSYPLSLFASFMSAIGQMAYVYSSFTRSPLIKYGICFFIAIPFLIGLVLFMGHFWWPWAIPILILYLPWESIDRRIANNAPRDRDFPDTTRGRNQRLWFIAVTGGLVGLHLYAVLSKTEFEPLYSNYPMYITEMRAGSPNEIDLWRKYTEADRNNRPVVTLVTKDGEEEDVSFAYRLAEFASSRSLYNSIYALLYPRYVYQLAQKNEPLDDDTCAAIRVAAERVSGGRARAVRYNRQYYDLTESQLSWRPLAPTLAITVDLADCSYRSP